MKRILPRPRGIVIWCFAMLLMPSFASAQGAASQVSQPVPVYFRGTPWLDAVAQVAARQGAAYTYERGIAPEVLKRPVRLAAEFLTGEQLLRWLARLGGVGVVSVGDQYVFGKPEAWPAAWRVRAAGPAAVIGENDAWLDSSSLHEATEDRLADIEWSDQTPSAALAEVRAKYRIDVIVDPAILNREELLTVARRQVGLPDLLTEMCHGWRAVWAYGDGAVILGGQEWVTSLADGRRAGDAFVGTVGGALRATSVLRGGIGMDGGAERGREASRPRWWRGWVRLDDKEKSWKKVLWPMMQLIGAAATWRADVSPRPRIADSEMQAEGKAGEVLEGLRLLGYLHWQRPAVGAPADAIEIRLQ